jgi:hypothetical protein
MEEVGLLTRLNMDEAIEVDDWDDSLTTTRERLGL